MIAVICIVLLFLLMVAIVHKMLHREFASYKPTYERMLNDNPVRRADPYLDGDIWHFNGDDIGIIETKGMPTIFFLENDAYKTYEETHENLGIIFNGIKGTGKTVTAKLLANRINKPIILVHSAFGGVNSFLAAIDQEMTIFIDEYDKVYRGNLGTDWDDNSSGEKADSSLLSLMDGVFSMSARRNFFLTTNNTYVNENMINRPGRIRYLKQYGDLTHTQINEIVDDLLKYPEHKESIISYLKLLEIITVDIVKALVMEVNIFNQPAEVCAKDMNMERKIDEYEVVRLPDGEGQKEEIMMTVPLVTYNQFMTRFQVHPLGGYINYDGTYLRVTEECKIPHVYTVFDANYGKRENSFNIRFKKKRNIHSSFAF